MRFLPHCTRRIEMTYILFLESVTSSKNGEFALPFIRFWSSVHRHLSDKKVRAPNVSCL